MKKILFLSIVLGLVFSGIGFGEEVKGKIEKVVNPDGKLDSEWTTYSDGTCGWKKYFPNGEVETEAIYKDCRRGDIGVHKTYYENGQLFSEWEDNEGKYTYLKEYYPNGKLRIVRVPTNGKDENKVSIQVRDAIITGEGGKRHEKVVHSGVQYVKQEVYDEQGNILKDGILKEYSQSGNISAEIPYKNGKAEGIGKEYSNDGKLAGEVIYKDGKKVNNANDGKRNSNNKK